MFKIKIEDLSHYADEKKTPYLIRYELAPEYCQDRKKILFHESKFSSLKSALKVSGDMSNYFYSCYTFLDLIYTKIKQLENNFILDKTYLTIDFNQVECTRIELIRSIHSENYAYKHIEKLTNFLNCLKSLCFNISKRFDVSANALFQMLESFHDTFKQNYRSSNILSESKQLKLFV